MGPCIGAHGSPPALPRLDTTRANAVVWDPQVTAAACPPLNDTTSPACVAGTAPLAAWQAVPLWPGRPSLTRWVGAAKKGANTIVR